MNNQSSATSRTKAQANSACGLPHGKIAGVTLAPNKGNMWISCPACTAFTRGVREGHSAAAQMSSKVIQKGSRSSSCSNRTSTKKCRWGLSIIQNTKIYISLCLSNYMKKVSQEIFWSNLGFTKKSAPDHLCGKTWNHLQRILAVNEHLDRCSQDTPPFKILQN